MIHGTLTSTDAVLAAHDAQDDGIDAEEVEIQPVRGVEKMPVGTRIEHDGKMWEVVFDADGKDCDGCAACCDFDLCSKLYSCEAGGRDDGLDVVMREVAG
jgi:hypothetical protein